MENKKYHTVRIVPISNHFFEVSFCWRTISPRGYHPHISQYLALSVPDESYSRKVLCALHLISMFLLISCISTQFTPFLVKFNVSKISVSQSNFSS